MIKSRICQICGNEIPEDAGQVCPKCKALDNKWQHFNQKYSDTKIISTRSKQNYSPKVRIAPKHKSKISLKEELKPYQLAGVIGEIISIIIICEGQYEGLYNGVRALVLFLPVGLLIGYFGYRLEKKFVEFLPIRFIFILITTIILPVFAFLLRLLQNI